MRATAIDGLDPAHYLKHRLHAEERMWVEKNCYIDIWIELVHALGLEPLAMLGRAIAIDFEGDQWTFFKPDHGDVFRLYGLDAQELNVWKPLHEHALEHLRSGKVISTEADAFWLPDTAGTDYQQKHTKTTIVLVDVDMDRRQLGYFHNAGYFRLTGHDFARTFRLDELPDPTFLPLFAETVRIDRRVVRAPAELRQLAHTLLAGYLARQPSIDAIDRFGSRMAADLPELVERGLNYYHSWAFGSTRQLGACAELLAEHLRWLADSSPGPFVDAAEALEEVSRSSKTLILKGARIVNARRGAELHDTFASMSEAWRRAMHAIQIGL